MNELTDEVLQELERLINEPDDPDYANVPIPRTDALALIVAARRLREVEAELQDCGMMIRRLLRQCDNQELKAKALDFVKRKGLQGSVLRTMEE